jgi:hypothetical protein
VFFVLQLITVQQRVHVALQLYYKYRGLYTVNELSRMQCHNKNSAAQLAELQRRIDQTLTAMSRFIHSQLNPSSPAESTADHNEHSDVIPNVTTGSSSTEDVRGLAADLSAGNLMQALST